MSKLDNEKKFFRTLKTELAIRQNNEHVGSGLGGNTTELFFLLTHKVNIGQSLDDKFHVTTLDNGEVLCSVPSKPSSLEARKKLTSFINSHPGKVDVTQDQLSNISFLKDLGSKSLDIKLLITALEEATILANWLDAKIEVKNNIDKLFDKEHRALEVCFLKEMNLPESYFKDLAKIIETQRGNSSFVEEDDPMKFMFNAHPVWGVKDKACKKRHEEMEFRLLSQEDLDRLNFIGTFPSYIGLFVFRSQIGIERLITLNLDERTDFLDKINKLLESKNNS